MNEEQLQRTIEFILQGQADFTAQQAILTEKHKEFEAADKRLQIKLDRLSRTVRDLGLLSRNLLEVEQIHAQRLDRLEGIQPH
jgi:hypothetical protein